MFVARGTHEINRWRDVEKRKARYQRDEIRNQGDGRMAEVEEDKGEERASPILYQEYLYTDSDCL